jgi:hypothetical protein
MESTRMFDADHSRCCGVLLVLVEVKHGYRF